MTCSPLTTDQPKISVITVSFNQGPFIRQNIESVMAQNYENVEHIIIDAVSTDGTVDILKEYPHLHWTSEKDRGQTHGLNKGFRKATGEIIGWLNSDDYYAPNIFQDVVAELQHSAVVLGQCEFINKEGNTTDIIENARRNWFDIWKYWIYHASPAQPAIFFRRDALEAVKRPPDQYLDEDLFFGMDLDLWLRLAEAFPFTNQSKKTYAYFRMYDENKTGADGAGMYREASRLFKLHGNRRSMSERRVSLVIDVRHLVPELQETLQSSSQQNLTDFEIILWNRSHDGREENRKELKSYARQLSESTSDDRFRYFETKNNPDSKTLSYGQGLLELSKFVRAPFMFIVSPGQVVEGDTMLKLSAYTELDSIGAVIITGNDAHAHQQLTIQDGGQTVFQTQCLFSGTPLPTTAAFRTLALQELSDLTLSENDDLSYRELLLLLQYKAWGIKVSSNEIVLDLKTAMSSPPKIEHQAQLLQAALINRVALTRENDLFADTRAKNGFIIEFPPDTVKAAQEFLETHGPIA